ncbi:MAG: hypothetical protein E6Q59_04975 [Nitrosomonas sp.]|nr:hypothetical protein [Nitrosomonas sp.]OQW84613.1 MAG: hypothetical protein BVN30_02975 [Proteobacteria bacterium ST_bin16]TXI39440.1 MAG: hypothetical protein E6Q59_04975 [Nitrosomonas sp.]
MKNLSWVTLAIILSYAHFAVASQDSNSKNEEDKIDFTMTGSGYFIHSSIQSREDGLTNHMNIRGKSKQIGEAIVNVLAEVRVKLENGVPENCITPQNDQGIRLDLVKARGVVQLAKSGDQIFTKGTKVDLCMSLRCFNEDGSIKEGCAFQPSATVEIKGGTGPFACATGHITDTHTRIVLAMNSKGEPFGSISSYSAQGTVQIPKSCDN